MADSPSSQSRAQLIREMSKDMNKTRNSSGSSRDSQGTASPEPTASDFDPENEAIMSTRQLDNHSHHLPELRASAQKYSRFTRSTDPDYAINTSAIGRAFPDFSQGGTSSEDDNVSIEIGRGVKKSSNGIIGKLGRSREYSSNAQLSLEEDSIDLSPPMIDNYEVTTTPPIKQRQASKKNDNGTYGSSKRETHVRKPSALHKEINDPSPPPAKTRDYGSGESRKASGESRPTLASMHARIRDENDQSRVSDERPPTIDLSVRNTRFGNTKNLQPPSQGHLPTRFSSAQTLLNSVAPINKQKLQNLGTPNQGTQQSFMLPDIPNISELVSGVFEDGTPVFSRHSKPRASRIVSVSQLSKTAAREYAGVNEIPVPDDEQAIFLSLKLLQDKVATLEKGNAEAAVTIEELQHRNRTLESEKTDRRRPQRSDSALGTTDSDGGHDISGGQRKLLIEKNRLETSARALQQQVDVGQRRYSTAETILKQITQERDSAISQLGVAFVTIEQLKVENENLKDENKEIKARLGQLGHGHKRETGEMTAEGVSSQQNLDPNTEAVKIKDQEKNSQTSRSQKTGTTSSRAQALEKSERRQAKGSSQNDVSTIFDLSSRQDTEKLHGKNRMGDVQEEDSDGSEGSGYEAHQGKMKGKFSTRSTRHKERARGDDVAQDLTYLSFLDNQEIVQLRKTLEQERIDRKNRHASNIDPTATQTGIVQPLAQSPQKAAPRKSSMKDLTARSARRKEITEADQPSEHNRRHSESSMLSVRSRRRGPTVKNMTSAFIVPDITIHNPEASDKQKLKLTKEGQEMIDSLKTHNGRNCMVCKRTVNLSEHHDHDKTAMESVRIARPVPVSERMPKATEEDGDPTIRPAQAPGLALATVLKELEDELAHLKIQLSQYQTLYNGHDPALSKRSRKSVQQKIETILQAIDIKADQIYALYDVLEGQKQDGHEISDEEVEITLQSIGIRAPELHLRGGGSEDEEMVEGGEKPTERHPWDLESDEDGEEDLPWEGFESTVETTTGGFARAARKKGYCL